MTTFTIQTYLISSLYQCVEMIHKIATTGKCSYEDYKHILMALSVQQFNSIEATFGGESALKSGIIACEKYFSMKSVATDYNASIQINRYFTELFRLESNIGKQHSLLKSIAEKVKLNADDFNDIDENIESLVKNFADIYTAHISSNTSPIMIRGTEDHLKNEFNAQKVRALLLSGLRIVMLWREVGGKQWHLFLKRRKIIENCAALKQSI